MVQGREVRLTRVPLRSISRGCSPKARILENLELSDQERLGIWVRSKVNILGGPPTL